MADDRASLVVLKFLSDVKVFLPTFKETEVAYLSLLVNMTTKLLIGSHEDKISFATMAIIIDTQFLKELLGFVCENNYPISNNKRKELSLYLLRNISAIEYYSLRIMSASHFGTQFLQHCLTTSSSQLGVARELLLEIIKLAIACFYS